MEGLSFDSGGTLSPNFAFEVLSQLLLQEEFANVMEGGGGLICGSGGKRWVDRSRDSEDKGLEDGWVFFKGGETFVGGGRDGRTGGFSLEQGDAGPVVGGMIYGGVGGRGWGGGVGGCCGG